MADHTGDITCIASSSSSSTNTGQVYEVFLNHRGPDTKKGLASHIYRRLIVRELNVFLDQPELRKGENILHQIKEAIGTASVHVAIFSPTYAQSTWCLEELALMVESKSTIIPVFHDVDPSELRWTQSGDGVFAGVQSILRCIFPQCILRWIFPSLQGEKGRYARALHRLEKKRTLDPDTNETKPRHDSSTLQRWRNALSVVSNRSGFVINAYNGDERQLGDAVVEEVWRKVRKTPLNVAKYPTGLDGKIEYVEITPLNVAKYPTGQFQISYDGLDKEEQEIFLDVACFFIGENRDTAIAIWNASGWDGWRVIRILQNRCLVEIDSEERIRMHEHLRDFGRDVAEKEHPLRLLRPNVNLLRTLSPSSPVRGISMEYEKGPEQFFENLAANCDLGRLELLRGQGSFVESVFRAGELRQLIYLRWENCPISSIFFTIPRNLIELYIQGEALKTLWQHESQAPLQLRELYIDAPLSEVPESIGKLNQLEKIVLKNSYFKSLPNEFYDMHSLKHITLEHCEQMMLLPDSVGMLTALQTLDLCSCSRLQGLPDSVGQLTGLRRLRLEGCTSLQGLPDSVGQLMGLQSLSLERCTSLQGLPDSVGQLTGLEELNLYHCSCLQGLPDSVGELTRLQSLYLHNCFSLQGLPDSVGRLTNLKYIDLSQCRDLEKLPSALGNLTKLHHIDLSQCSNLKLLPDSFGNLTNLYHIDLTGCFNLETFPQGDWLDEDWEL